MPVSFPISPALNETYTFASNTWKWDGFTWKLQRSPVAGPAGPAGPTGAQGATGAAATIAVGTTTTGAEASSASVTNSGTSSAATFNFTIPRGASGGITLSVTNSGMSSYTINGASNPTLSFIRGHRYVINVTAPGHPFWIQTVSGAYSAGNVYNTGVTNNGTASGTIIFEVPFNAPQLYYVCQNHPDMAGSITVSNLGPTGTSFTYKGAHNMSLPYSVNDVVTYQGTTYVNIQNVPAFLTTPDLYPAAWSVMAAKGDTGPASPSSTSNSGGSVTLSSSNVNRLLVTSGSGLIFILPANDSGLADGASWTLMSTSTSTAQINANGRTTYSTTGLTLRARYSVATVIYSSALNGYVIFGDLVP